MPTRREMLAGAAGAGLIAISRARLAGAATTVKTPVDFDVPRNACDCHVHIFDPAHFPYDPARVYSPPPASIAELLDLQSALHFDRVIIVTPSVYGVDNAVTLDAIRKLGPRARGVAVINASTTAAALDDMAAIGIRGVRLNLETAGESDPDVARRMLLEAAELPGCAADRPCHGGGKPRPRGVGQHLAAPRPRPLTPRNRPAASERRRHGARSIAELGARSCDPQAHPGRQPGKALRLRLKAVPRARPIPPRLRGGWRAPCAPGGGRGH